MENACPYFVYKDMPNQVHEYCEFTTRKQVLESEIIRVTDAVYVVTNASNVRINCPHDVNASPSERRNTTITQCQPCQVQLDCGCTMQASGEMGVVHRTGDRGCGRETVSVMHAVNLLALQTFYETTRANLTGQKLLEPGTFKQPANLTINFFSDEAKKLLARDDEVAYSLKKLAKGLRNDSLVYCSATDAILFEYMQKQNDNSILVISTIRMGVVHSSS